MLEVSKQNDLMKADVEKQKAAYEARLKAIEDKLKALPADTQYFKTKKR